MRKRPGKNVGDVKGFAYGLILDGYCIKIMYYIRNNWKRKNMIMRR